MGSDEETQRTFKCYQDEVISTSPPRSTLTYINLLTEQIRENGMIVLGSPVPNPPQPIPFNIDLVETLLFFSSVVYYRGNPNYNKMTDTTKSTIKKRRNDAEKTIVEIIRPWGIKFHSFGELSSTENIFAGLF
ncbi:8506_t:CDS:2, partial [Diversispora eburnea]